MSGIQKVAAAFRAVAVYSSYTSIVALLIMMVLTFCDVLLRSTINSPIEVSTELSRILLMITVFGSLPLITLREEHVTVDLLSSLLDRIGYIRIEGLVYVATAGLMLWPAEKIHELAERSRRYGDATEFLHFPVYIGSWFVFIFTVVMALCFLIVGLDKLFGSPNKNKSSHGI